MTAEKKLEQMKQTKPVQMHFFELLDPDEKNYSNTIELYDAIPKYIWSVGRKKSEIIRSSKRIKRNFVYKNQEYQVIITPAIIEDKNGQDKVVFPSQREEIVEDALRKLASDGKGVFLDDQAGVFFSLYELQQELQRMGHGYKITDIKEAILVCGKSNIEVNSPDGNSILLSNIFTTVGLQTKEDWKSHGRKSKAFIHFNPLVTKSIKEKSFRLINYDKSMRYKQSLARWMHKRMSHNFTQASYTETYHLLLSTIIRDSGINQYPKLKDNIYQVQKALDEMKEHEALGEYSVETVKDGRRIIDAKFVLRPHSSFIKDAKFANKRSKDIKQEDEHKEHLERLKKFRMQLGQELEKHKIG